VLDANLNVVARLSLYGGQGLAGSLRSGRSVFVPEDGPLDVSADQGARGQWSGLGLDAQTPLPNGYYRLRLSQPGLAPVETAFWIRHASADGAELVILGGPGTALSGLSIHYRYPAATSIEARVYNLAGELVSHGSAQGTAGVMRLAMRAASGGPVAAGVYLVQLRGVDIVTGAESLKLLKTAVIR
jgi:hypothetical protein